MISSLWTHQTSLHLSERRYEAQRNRLHVPIVQFKMKLVVYPESSHAGCWKLQEANN